MATAPTSSMSPTSEPKPIADPRAVATRQLADVAITLVDGRSLADFTDALTAAEALAIDTETAFIESDNATDDPGDLRVISAATRAADGAEQAWVVDVWSVDAAELAECLAALATSHATLSDKEGNHDGNAPWRGVAGWNASFDSGVLVRALGPAAQLVWWDAMLADALLHQGASGFGFYHSLAWAAERYLGLSISGKGTTQLSYADDNPLTDEQVRYAAHDAVATLWVAHEVSQRIAEAELEQVCALEQDARPFLEQMREAGLPLDSDGWEQELEAARHHRDQVLAQLAHLTGGGQANLFGGEMEPSFNPNSEQQVRDVLNAHASAEVAAYTRAAFGVERPLGPNDSLGASALVHIGGEICETLIAYRDVQKLLSTYGEGLRQHVGKDGRMHPQYLQIVGTHTGRLASRNPNAQNLTPKVKPFIRAPQGRTFVYADLNQAELRFAAQVSGDEALTEAFAQGHDIHLATAERMFGVDMEALRDSDPKNYDTMRTKAKRINFGILYGQRGAGLARGLTEGGVPTTPDEADDLIDTYLTAYPGLAAWVNERDRFVADIAHGGHDVDWSTTLALDERWRRVEAARRQLREHRRGHHSAEEVHEAVAATSAAVVAERGAEVSGPAEISLAETAWCLRFHAPVVLDASGEPFGFSSRTKANRRQQFTIGTDGVLGEASMVVAMSHKVAPQRAWAHLLSGLGRAVPQPPRNATNVEPPLGRAEASRVLERRDLRRQLLASVGTQMGTDALHNALNRGLTVRIEQLANAYRNSPIQGGIADVMLDAYGLLHRRLGAFNRAVGVQTVHDSVVIECDTDEASEVAQVVHRTLADAMKRWCADVPAVVDTDVRTSLDDADVTLRL